MRRYTVRIAKSNGTFEPQVEPWLTAIDRKGLFHRSPRSRKPWTRIIHIPKKCYDFHERLGLIVTAEIYKLVQRLKNQTLISILHGILILIDKLCLQVQRGCNFPIKCKSVTICIQLVRFFTDFFPIKSLLPQEGQIF